MLVEKKVVDAIVQYLDERKEELIDNDSIRYGYQQALRFVEEYLMEVQDDLEREYQHDKYSAESRYSF